MSGMSNYERMRDERIRANRQLMIDLGLESAVKGLSALAPAPAPRKPAAPRAPREKKEKAEELPSRRSKRLRSGAKKEGQDAEDDDGEEEELLELVEEPKERVYRPRAGRSMEERMKELEMGALVDLDEGHALFIVMGSTRKPYRVSLGAKSAARPIASTCQCMDFRLRKHECKHIKLLKQTLGVAPDNANWAEAAAQYVREGGEESAGVSQ